MKKQQTALDRPLKQRGEVSLSSFSFLFSEIVQNLLKQTQKDASGNEMDIEAQLHDLGLPIGEKVLELMSYRDKGGSQGACNNGKRETKLVNMLHFINNQVWKLLFGKQADGLEQSIEDEDEYRIIDRSPLTNKFTSTGKGGSSVNCASFIGGILEGILCSANMSARVSVHSVKDEESEDAMSTLFVIKLSEETMKRENNL